MKVNLHELEDDLLTLAGERCAHKDGIALVWCDEDEDYPPCIEVRMRSRSNLVTVWCDGVVYVEESEDAEPTELTFESAEALWELL